VLAALQHNQAQLDELAEQWQQTRRKLKAEQSKLRVKLAQERRWGAPAAGLSASMQRQCVPCTAAGSGSWEVLADVLVWQHHWAD
jgi:hypothetical protein